MDEIKNLKDLEKITKHCRKNGLKRLKLGDFELEFSDSALFPESTYKKNQAETLEEPVKPTYTPEQILMWSSQGLDEGVN